MLLASVPLSADEWNTAGEGASGYNPFTWLRRRLCPRDPDRLHDVMAGRTQAQAKLSQVVNVIGDVIDSEVCSVHPLRDCLPKL
jgi:hypothetical protein